MSQAADPRAKLSRAAVHWALTGLVVHHLTVARIAQALGMSWNTANTADPAYSPRVSSTRYSTCFPTTSTSPLRSPGASTRTSPDAYRSSNARGGKTLTHEEIARLNSTGMPSSLTELTTLGRTLKRRAVDILAYFDHPPHQQRPHRSHQRTPRTPTRLRPRIPKPHPLHHPSTPRNRRTQTPNNTHNYEEP